MRGRAVGLLVFASVVLVAPATASAANRVKEGSYHGVTGGIEVSFDLSNDGGGPLVENFELSRQSCGRPCSLRMLAAEVRDRKASFTGTSIDAPLSWVELNWEPNGYEVEGTWAALSAENGAAFETTIRSFRATFQFDGPQDPNDPGPGDPGAQGRAARAGPPATVAATRSEFVLQLDPICRSFENPAAKLLTAFSKQTAGVLKAQAKTDSATVERRLLGPFGRLVSGANKLIGKMTVRMAGVPAPTGDEAAIAAWLESRRAYRRVADRAVQAGKRRKVAQLFRLLEKAGKKIKAGDRLVAGFGFQQCVFD